MCHKNNVVQHLLLSSGDDLGVTAPHRMFSADRHAGG
jgi:hypothetical protein